MSGRVTRTKSGAVKRNYYAEDDISDLDFVDVQSNETDDDDNYQSDDTPLKMRQKTMAHQTKRKKKATSRAVNEQAAPVEEPSAEAIRLGEYLKSITTEAKAEDITYACGLCNVGFEEGEEVGLSLPCGHVFGHNCLAGRSTCPVARCKTTLYYPNCRHPIPLTAFRLGLFTQRENEKPFKCVDCTIKDIEHGVNLQGLEFHKILADINYWQSLMEEINSGKVNSQSEAVVTTNLWNLRNKLAFMEHTIAEVREAAARLGW